MCFSRLFTALLPLLLVLAPHLSAQTEQAPPSSPSTPTQPAQAQPAPDYSKLQHKIPLVNEKASEPIVDLAFSHTSQIIAVLYQSSIGFWHTSTGAPIGFARGTREKFTALAFGSNGLLATGGENGGVALWDWRDLAQPKLRTGGFDAITAVAVSPDSSLIVTAQRSETPGATVWDAKTGKLIRTLTGFSHAPTALHFTPDGAQLLTGGGGLGGRTGEFLGETPLYSSSGEFTRWDMRTGTLEKQVGLSDASPNCAFSPDGTLLATVGGGAAVAPRSTLGRERTSWLGTSVRVWRVPGESENDNGGFLPITLRRGPDYMVRNSGRPSIAFSPDQRVLGFSESYQIMLWSGGAGRPSSLPLSYPYPDRYWYFDDYFPFLSSGAMAFSPDGKMLAVGGYSRAGIWKMGK
jgi:WD40 repeat protein